MNLLSTVHTKLATGCSEQVKLESIVAHVSGCDYQTMMCTNSCGRRLLKKQLQNHLMNTCSHRIIQCQYCAARHQHNQVLYHYQMCLEFPQICANRCEQLGLKRKDMDNHKEICPLEMVKCTFYEVGCTHCGQRKDLAAHVKENIENHLSLTMAAHLKLLKAHSELKQQVERMKKPP